MSSISFLRWKIRGGPSVSVHPGIYKLTQAFTPIFAPLVVPIAFLPQQHPLQLLPLLLLPLTGKLGTGFLVLQHVLDVLPHLLKVTVLCWAAVSICGQHLCRLQHSEGIKQRIRFHMQSHWSIHDTQTLTRVSLVLQVKYSLAFLLVALLVFRDRETRTPGELAHGALTWTCLLCRHGSNHIDHLPTWKFFDLVQNNRRKQGWRQLYHPRTCLFNTNVSPLLLVHQTCAGAAWHFSVTASSGQRLSPSRSSWQAGALCHPKENKRDQRVQLLYVCKEEQKCGEHLMKVIRPSAEWVCWALWHRRSPLHSLWDQPRL